MPEIDNSEFRRLVALLYDGRQVRFAEEAGYGANWVSGWWRDKRPVPQIVLLFLRERKARLGL